MTDWVSVATAPNQLEAEMLCELLRGAGIPARLRPGDAVSFLGVSAISCSVLVPGAMAEEARALLEERGPDLEPGPSWMPHERQEDDTSPERTEGR